MDRPSTDLLTPIFGSPFPRFLYEPLLIIGKDKWHRLDLSDMGISQLRAVRIVTNLAREYRARSVEDLYDKIGPASLASNNGVGLHSLYVLWRAFEAKGLDPTSWYWKGRDGAIVTFTSLKSREHKAAAQEKRQRPRRAQVALDDARRQRKSKKATAA
jgi:hypothetical protein